MTLVKGISKLNRMRLVMCLTVPLLFGCVSEEFGDLNEYISSVKARKPGEIEPLPVIKSYASFRYVKEGLRNPFAPINKRRRAVLDGEGILGPGPDLHRAKEELEGFPLDTLRMVGTIDKAGQMWGLVKAGDGMIHRVLPGQYMGRNFGQIQKIDAQKIQIEEYVVSGEGRWVKRLAGLGLSD